jgi:hypothetical protein
MSPALIAAAVRLAGVLENENRALGRLDLPAATALLDAKTTALGAFTAAQALEPRKAAGSSRPFDAAEGRALVERLADLARENRRLLEHAIAVQGRIIGMVARAAPRASGNGGRYGARGAHALTRREAAVAISTKA